MLLVVIWRTNSVQARLVFVSINKCYNFFSFLFPSNVFGRHFKIYETKKKKSTSRKPHYTQTYYTMRRAPRTVQQSESESEPEVKSHVTKFSFLIGSFLEHAGNHAQKVAPHILMKAGRQAGRLRQRLPSVFCWGPVKISLRSISTFRTVLLFQYWEL